MSQVEPGIEMQTDPTETELRAALDKALAELCANHAHLFSVDANERSITHWLAAILARLLPGLDVDCEYNRSGELPKRLRRNGGQHVSADDSDAQSVYPDVIVHRRGPDANFLVIEAKKTTRARAVIDDIEKLKGYTEPASAGGLGYRCGALVVFETNRGSAEARVQKWLGQQQGPA
jgi:hypothetical protein